MYTMHAEKKNHRFQVDCRNFALSNGKEVIGICGDEEDDRVQI
jgi:hypothetical protein